MPCSEILLNTEQLNRIVSRLARGISCACPNIDNYLAIVVMDGAKYFAKDLLAKLDFGLDVEYVKASSYQGTCSSGSVTIDGDETIQEKIRGKNILLIDDIYDTGSTLFRIIEWLNQYEPNSIQTCVLLEKRHTHSRDIDIDFVGTPIEDAFIVGYGLDYNGQYRDLPFIGVLSEALIR